MQFLTSSVCLAILGAAAAQNLKNAVLLCPNAELTFAEPAKSMPAIVCIGAFSCQSATDGVKSGNLWTSSCIGCPPNQQISKFECTNVVRRCRASEDMKPEWTVQDSGHVIARGLEIAGIHATTPGYPSIVPGSTIGGKTVINELRRLPGLSTYPDVSPIDGPSGSERERAFENALRSEKYRSLGDAFVNGVSAAEKISPSISKLTRIFIV
ncbi:hypothetical protein FVER53590_00063 [Fusarium verticillioides]|nr:hypothetical protein FVER53590_00063 [Fusarium verticillioides]